MSVFHRDTPPDPGNPYGLGPGEVRYTLHKGPYDQHGFNAPAPGDRSTGARPDPVMTVEFGTFGEFIYVASKTDPTQYYLDVENSPAVHAIRAYEAAKAAAKTHRP